MVLSLALIEHLLNDGALLFSSNKFKPYISQNKIVQNTGINHKALFLLIWLVQFFSDQSCRCGNKTRWWVRGLMNTIRIQTFICSNTSVSQRSFFLVLWVMTRRLRASWTTTLKLLCMVLIQKQRRADLHSFRVFISGVSQSWKDLIFVLYAEFVVHFVLMFQVVFVTATQIETTALVRWKCMGCSYILEDGFCLTCYKYILKK